MTKKINKYLRNKKKSKNIEKKAFTPDEQAGPKAKPNQPKIAKKPIGDTNSPYQAMQHQGQVKKQGDLAPKASFNMMNKNPRKENKKRPSKSSTVLKSEGKSIKHNITESELNTKCIHCGIPEFRKSEDGTIHYQPCACFAVTKLSEKGHSIPFVQIIRKSENGMYELKFNPKADKDVVNAFLTTIKKKLLEYKG